MGTGRVHCGSPTIVVRRMTPALVTRSLFQVVGIGSGSSPPRIRLADEQWYPTTLGLDDWRTQIRRLPEFSQRTTGGVLLPMMPLVIAIIVLQRCWRWGLTEGPVTG